MSALTTKLLPILVLTCVNICDKAGFSTRILLKSTYFQEKLQLWAKLTFSSEKLFNAQTLLQLLSSQLLPYHTDQNLQRQILSHFTFA